MKTICLFIFRHIIARFVSTEDFVRLMMQNNLTPVIYEALYNQCLSSKPKLICSLDKKYGCSKMYNGLCLSSFPCRHQKIEGE